MLHLVLILKKKTLFLLFFSHCKSMSFPEMENKYRDILLLLLLFIVVLLLLLNYHCSYHSFHVQQMPYIFSMYFRWSTLPIVLNCKKFGQCPWRKTYNKINESDETFSAYNVFIRICWYMMEWDAPNDMSLHEGFYVPSDAKKYFIFTPTFSWLNAWRKTMSPI